MRLDHCKCCQLILVVSILLYCASTFVDNTFTIIQHVAWLRLQQLRLAGRFIHVSTEYTVEDLLRRLETYSL